LLVKGDETHLPNNPTTYHTTMKRTFFLLGACSLLALFSGNKASAEAADKGKRGPIETDCGTIYYGMYEELTDEEYADLQRDLSKSDCVGSKKRDRAWPNN
jgi:hypothetical protein